MFKFVLIFIMVLFISACGESKKVMAVNDKNCEIGNIKKIVDLEKQKDFSSKCLRRNSPRDGNFEKSKKKEW